MYGNTLQIITEPAQGRGSTTRLSHRAPLREVSMHVNQLELENRNLRAANDVLRRENARLQGQTDIPQIEPLHVMRAELHATEMLLAAEQRVTAMQAEEAQLSRAVTTGSSIQTQVNDQAMRSELHATEMLLAAEQRVTTMQAEEAEVSRAVTTGSSIQTQVNDQAMRSELHATEMLLAAEQRVTTMQAEEAEVSRAVATGSSIQGQINDQAMRSELHATEILLAVEQRVTAMQAEEVREAAARQAAVVAELPGVEQLAVESSVVGTAQHTGSIRDRGALRYAEALGDTGPTVPTEPTMQLHALPGNRAHHEVAGVAEVNF